MICQFAGRVNLYNRLCLQCSLFLECCLPTHSTDGYANNAECDIYLCEGCDVPDCQADLERDRTA